MFKSLLSGFCIVFLVLLFIHKCHTQNNILGWNENSFGVYIEGTATGHGTLTGHINYTLDGRYTLDLGVGASTDIEYIWRTYSILGSVLILKQKAGHVPINTALEVSRTFHSSYEENKNNFGLEVSRNFRSNNRLMLTPIVTITVKKPHFVYVVKYGFGLNIKINQFYFEAIFGTDKYGTAEYFSQLGYLF